MFVNALLLLWLSLRSRPFAPAVAVSVMAVCLVVCWGCSGQSQQRRPGYLYARLKTNPVTLDPALIVDLDSARLAAKLFNGLVRFDETLQPVPDLAASWTISEDGRVYTFVLKRGLRFCNGREVTASDVVYSFERVLHPATRSPRTWVLSRIRGTRAFREGRTEHVAGLRLNGPFRLEVELEEPFAPFICMLGLTTAYIVPREEVGRWGVDFGRRAGGTGPFRLAVWQQDQHVVLEANPFYCGDKPLLDGIWYRIIPEDFTAIVEFEKGGLDLLPELQPAYYSRFARDPLWAGRITASAGLNTYYIGLNCQLPPFDDVRVRRAVNYAVDREKIVASLLEGRGQVARGPLPPLLRQQPVSTVYGYDPEKARTLLREAGYAGGLTISLYQTADQETLDICQVIQEYLRQVGIEVDIVQLEWSTFLDVVARGEAQAFWLSWWADYPDAENFLLPTFHSMNIGPGGNRSRYADPVTDDLIARAMAAPEERRRELYGEIENRVVGAAPWVYCWHKSVSSIHQPYVKGYRPRPLAVMDTWTKISIKKQED